MIHSAKTNGWAFATLIAAMLGSGLAYVSGVDSAQLPPAATAPPQPNTEAEPIAPLPLMASLDNRKVELGRRLFHDTALSGDGSISCASCHNLASGGVDRLVRSRGIGGKEGAINAPTVFNSGFSFRQFWNGRVETLDEQVDGPLQHPAEMGATWPQVIAVLSKDPAYRAEFAAIYRDGIQPHNVRDALATFERSLVTPNSRFDRFLRGDRTALSEKELAGYRLFKRLGCASCHQGVNIGGNMYQKLGVMEDYFTARGNITEADLGRYSITRREEDRHVFKVPSLRNIALTMPYLHDGSATTLEDAVRVMARYQLGEKLDTDELEKIVAFLKTLTGEYRGKPLE